MSLCWLHLNTCVYIGILKHILFCDDQLTVERARGSQDIRVNSETMEEALLGLEPAIADWHAEANYLQVQCMFNILFNYMYTYAIKAFKERTCSR